MMQLLGLGSLALLLPIAVWGYRLLGHRPLRHERLRVLLWLFGAVLAAAFASCLPRGIVGRCRAGSAAWSATQCSACRLCCSACRLLGHIGLVAAIVLGLAALAAFGGAAGIILRGAQDEEEETAEAEAEADDEEDDDGAWISLGGLMHTVLSFRSRAGAAYSAARCGRRHKRRGRGAATPRRSAGSSRVSTADRMLAHGKKKTTKTTRRSAARQRAARKPRAATQSRRAVPTAATSCRRSISSASRANSAAPPSAAKCCRRTPPRWKACWPISVCAARSSMRGRGRWSRFTSWSRRPASNPRASSASPTTLPVP